MQHKESIAEPYPGPRPYDKSEHCIFFGREEETADLRDLCMSYQLVILYSQSGAGKSSLVRAGLRPSLIARRIRVLPILRVGGQADRRTFNDSRNIFVENAVGSLLGYGAPAKQDLTSALRATSSDQGRARLVVFDQFEELFTSYPDRWRDRDGFFKQLNDALRRDHELRTLLVIREEHIAELDTFCDTVPTNLRIRYRLERLKDAAAKAAIQKPCTIFGWKIEDGDAARLITNLRRSKVRLGDVVDEVEGEYVEPVYLQVVCRDVWNSRNSNTGNKLVIPDNVEGIDRSLIAYYEAALKLASHDGRVRQGKIRSWIDRELITQRGTRSYVLMGDKRTEGLPNVAVAALEAKHIVRSEPRSGESWLELTHDRLIAPIRRSNLNWKRRTRFWRWPLYGLIMLSLCICGWTYLPRVYLSHIKSQANEIKLEADGLAAQAAVVEANAVRANSRQMGSLIADWPAVTAKYKAALVDYKKANDTTRLAEIYQGAGHAYMHMHKYKEAAQNFASAIDADRNINDRLASDWVALGEADYLIGNTREALLDYKRANNILKRRGDTTRETDLLRHLGDAQLRYGDYEKAATSFIGAASKIDRFEQAGELFEDLFGLGLSVSQEGHYSNGQAIYKAVFSDQTKLAQSITAVKIVPPARLLREIGFDELHEGQYSDAARDLRLAYDEAADSNDLEQKSYSALTLAEYYLEVPPDARRERGNGLVIERSGGLSQAKANLNRSMIFAQEAHERFRQTDTVMDASAITYIARSKISMAATADKTSQRNQLLTEADQELKDALTEVQGKRRVGEAFTLQAQGILLETKGDYKEAAKAYQKSYCLYFSMKSVSIHKTEVKKSLVALGQEALDCTPAQAGYPEKN